jgi:hypothetical protein
VPHCKRLILSISALAVLALPTFATTPRRHAAPAPFDVKITGVVTDAITGKPVASADVAIVNSRAKAATDADGKFTVTAQGGYTIAVQASRSGYTAVTKNVPGTGDATVNFTLTPTATATVRDISGNVTNVDVESFKFAYLVAFSGYVTSNTGNFCMADGTAAHPDRSEIAKLIGPATPVSQSKCCTIGPIMSMQVVFKNGTTSTVYLADSCFGNEVDVLGREHATGQFVYFNLTNVAEVDLP